MTATRGSLSVTRMRYELWQRVAGYSFFPEDNESARKTLEAGSKLMKVFEADSWEDASRQKNEFLGWEPYKPMGPPG